MFCPQYETLSISAILTEFGDCAELWPYFPDKKEVAKLPRQWIVNVLYSVIGEPFSDFVRQQITDRNQKMQTDHNLNIELDPEIAEAFKQSNQISSRSHLFHFFEFWLTNFFSLVIASKGIGANLLKIGSWRQHCYHGVMKVMKS